jgi:hypothetical protein
MQQNSPAGNKGVLVGINSDTAILPKVPATKQYLEDRSPLSPKSNGGERSPLSLLQHLIHEQRLTEALALLEDRGFYGDMAIFLLNWIQYEGVGF